MTDVNASRARWRDLLRSSVLLPALACGIALRLIWPADMEWKADEQRMFEWASAVGATQPWPALGMESGVQIRNPGLSIWVFVPLARIAGDPVALAQLVALVNVLALLGFAILGASKAVPEQTRRVWFAGIALQAINPMAVVLSRKIWAQSLMPAFALATFAGHTFRSSRAGAFAWGLAGMLAGQVHMSGFFLQAALAVWTWLSERRPVRAAADSGVARTRWWACLAGSLVGAIPVLPWVRELVRSEHGVSRDWAATLVPRGLYAWLIDGLGLNTSSVYRPEWLWSLAEPRIGGVPTYGMAVAQVALIGIAIYCLARWLRTIRPGFVPARDAGDVWLWIYTAAFGVTCLLMLAGVRARSHYLIVLYPLPFVWLAWLITAYGGPRVFRTALVLQLLITVTILTQVHRDGGVANGAYGVSYREQMRQRATP